MGNKHYARNVNLSFTNLVTILILVPLYHGCCKMIYVVPNCFIHP